MNVYIAYTLQNEGSSLHFLRLLPKHLKNFHYSAIVPAPNAVSSGRS
ncbi:hypothetical protein QW060_17740 [Myroides ceti]|uniref:Uncharacterized protein n=1 Tax=Paenimyroides ceti TaxID=395087 RepID=A0ABT8CXQ7_9FLAO|nr:hypothetical protein [Paenimyroides ceti]MDN3707950.1 hypothetical protein [Paenimyroides ceti]MDN3708924.1 hypothetical protein [Paenimyroides ceti]